MNGWEMVSFRANENEVALLASLSKILNRTRSEILRMAVWELAKSKLDNQGESEAANELTANQNAD